MSQDVKLPILTGAGNLAQYIRTVNSIPLLSAEEEHELAEKLSQEGDLNAAKKLILSHLRLVVSIAREYEGYGLNQADLIQEGNIGLMKAVKRFDPSRGYVWYPSLSTGLKLKSMNLSYATGVWCEWQRPNPNANCFSICAACVKIPKCYQKQKLKTSRMIWELN